MIIVLVYFYQINKYFKKYFKDYEILELDLCKK